MTHESPVWDIAFSADDRNVVSGSLKPTVHVQNVASGAAHVIEAASGVEVIGISADSRTIALSTEAGIELHDLESGKSVGATLAARRGDVREMKLRQLAFSPDGKLLVSGGDSELIMVWGLATARPLGAAINPALGQLRHLIFTSDGKRLVASGTDPDAWMREVCRVAQGELGAAEWQRFVGTGVQVPRCR